MKVTAYKTVDVECEVEIDADQIIAEFKQRVGEASAGYWRRIVPALDLITRILADVKPEVIAAFPEAGRQTMHQRLADQAERWTMLCPICGVRFPGHSDGCCELRVKTTADGVEVVGAAVPG